jgi:origin recognition complex subunit 3
MRLSQEAKLDVINYVCSAAPGLSDLDNFVGDIASGFDGDIAKCEPSYFLEKLQAFVKESFTSYKTFYFHESMVPDNAQLQENVFLPTYRGAIELALSDPKHYLGKSLTENKSFEPPLVVLYRLYRESSLFINIYDYYVAFKEAIPAPVPSQPDWNLRVLAWFLQGISELKFIGILRDSKRKFECVEKVTWKDM